MLAPAGFEPATSPFQVVTATIRPGKTVFKGAGKWVKRGVLLEG